MLEILVLGLEYLIMLHYISSVTLGEELLELVTVLGLIVTLVVLIYQTIELKKSTKNQAYQNVLSNYINCITEKGEPLYEEIFKEELKYEKINKEDILSFGILMNTFEMLYIQKIQKIIDDDIWDPWRHYFIKTIIIKHKYKYMWGILSRSGLYHKGLVKIVEEEVTI